MSELEGKLGEQANILQNLQQKVNDLASKVRHSLYHNIINLANLLFLSNYGLTPLLHSCTYFQYEYNPDESYVEVEAQLRTHLESFLETARTFNTIYTKVVTSGNIISLYLS